MYLQVVGHFNKLRVVVIHNAAVSTSIFTSDRIDFCRTLKSFVRSKKKDTAYVVSFFGGPDGIRNGHAPTEAKSTLL